MTTVQEAAEALESAARTVADVRVYGDPQATIDPPAVFVGLPRLTWDAVCNEPTSATFPVYVIAAMSDRVRELLPSLAIEVARALETVADAVVTRADALPFNASGSDLPAYELSTEVAL